MVLAVAGTSSSVEIMNSFLSYCGSCRYLNIFLFSCHFEIMIGIDVLLDLIIQYIHVGTHVLLFSNVLCLIFKIYISVYLASIVVVCVLT